MATKLDALALDIRKLKGLGSGWTFDGCQGIDF